MADADVVIIGSGYGGAVLATRLAEAGMSVVVLERGPRLASSDFRQSDDPAYIFSVIEFFVTSSNIAYRTGTAVGGASLPMDGAHFRMPRSSFEARDDAGRRYWPEVYSRGVLDPYFARAEQMLSIRQFDWHEIPKSGGLFAKMLHEVGATADRARMNYADCLQCGFCTQGCIYDKKKSLILNYIPDAEAAGAEFRANALVDHIEPAADGYAVVYERNGAAETITGTRVIVACGGIHSPGLLLRSREHLPALNEHVGAHFNNNGEHAYLGILPPEFDNLDDYYCYMGMDNAGIMSYHWFDSHGFTLHPGGGFEPSVLAAALAAADHPVLPQRHWGMEYKRFIEAIYPHRLIGFSTLGLADGYQNVTLRGDGTTDIVNGDRSQYDAYLDSVDEVMTHIEAETGITLVPSVPRSQVGTTSAHLLSSCRMADRAQDGVVSADGEVFGYENLYVCDASSLPFALGVNPALTIAAVAERTAEQIINRG